MGPPSKHGRTEARTRAPFSKQRSRASDQTAQELFAPGADSPESQLGYSVEQRPLAEVLTAAARLQRDRRLSHSFHSQPWPLSVQRVGTPSVEMLKHPPTPPGQEDGHLSGSLKLGVLQRSGKSGRRLFMLYCVGDVSL